MPTNQTDEKWPQVPEPYWRDSIHLPEFPRLQEDICADVVIVGGGLTGITSAYLLACEGVKVALLEADKLANGTSAHMMGKVTLQHGIIYDEIIRNIGEDRAKLYYEANAKAFDFIKQTISHHHIDCDFSKQDACLYAVSDKAIRKLEKEEKAYQKLGIDYQLVDQIPFDIEIKSGLAIKNQVQFHPLKYLAHLIQVIRDKGGLIFENTPAVNVKAGLRPQVLTRDGVKVTGNYVLSCSHFPFYEGIGLFWTRMYADRSYILGVKTKENFPGGLYISVDKPVRSLRAVPLGGDKMVLISGEGHQTGQGKDTMEHYQALKTFGQEIFDITDMMYRWSTQDLITIDKVPYIGPVSSDQPNILVATSFR